MDKQEFKDFCHREFTRRGFKKHKNMYYRKSEEHGLLCGLELQHSQFGRYYYINCDFFIGTFGEPKTYPTKYEYDLYRRPFLVLSRRTWNGEHYITGEIDYETYTEEELLPIFAEAFDKRIMPALLLGKKELRDHLDVWDTPKFDKEREADVLRRLNE